MKRKGFTLVELLAVIVVLAVVLAIAIPSISNIMNISTRKAFEVDSKIIIKAIDYKVLEDSSFDPTIINENNISALLLNISNSNYQAISVTTLNGKPYVVINGKNKWNGLVAHGSLTDMTVSDSSNYVTIINQLGYDGAKGVNEPKLVQGMTPIKWDGTKWVDTSASDTDWYDYNTKKWANARTADGSMWVWIPRYIYKITSNWHSNTTGTIDVQFSKGIDDNWNNSVIENIDIGTTSSASNNKWTNQPAFDFGSTKLRGIWVAKFEATAVEGVANGYTHDGSCMIGDNVITKTVKIIPNALSWRCIHIGDAFTAIRSMEENPIYGWIVASGLQANGSFTTDTNNIDTHLIKNTEWGAVSYLSKSNYGQGNDEIWKNPADNYTTGCAGNSVSPAQTTGCLNTYETANGVKASTTGNIYGIYDMSGGAYERVSAYVDNAHSNLNSYASSIVSANSKYKDIYTKGTTDDQSNNYALTINQKGDALYETSSSGLDGPYSWFNDASYTPYSSIPWFNRGGGFISSGSLPGPFNFTYTAGNAKSYDGFRPVIAVNAGL